MAGERGQFVDVWRQVIAVATHFDQMPELRHALAQVHTLSGLLPVCASCKSIRDGKGCWRPADEYLRDHAGATVSHGMCPDCTVRLYPSAYRETGHAG